MQYYVCYTVFGVHYCAGPYASSEATVQLADIRGYEYVESARVEADTCGSGVDMVTGGAN